ncbi:hypothetical protein [Pacificibacter sp. AS14]|uniref:hypothetical protein n=1 Tax=Pacificibacter sp. AS14 TaxID=3135785 RepID=UPI003180E19F
MFKISQNHAFTHTVKVQTPIDDDEFRTDTFKARFKMLPSNEAEAFDLRSPEGTKDFVRAVVLSTEDILGEDNKPMPHTPELLEQLISVYAVRIEFVNTYFAAVTKARLGN